MSGNNLQAVFIWFWAISVPFAWGHIARIDAQLIRPSDIIFILLAVMVIFRGRIFVTGIGRALFMLMSGVMLLVVFSSGAHGASLGPGLRLLSLIFVPFVLADALRSQNYTIPGRAVLPALVLVLIAGDGLFGHFADTLRTATSGDINSTIFNFFNGLFQINPFGPQDFEVRGIGYRNSLAIGLVTILVFAYGFMQTGAARSVVIAVTLVLVVVSLSRSAWVVLVVFIILSMLQDKVRSIFFVALLVTCIPLFYYGSVATVVMDRLNSDVGRFPDYAVALNVLFDNFLLGDPFAKSTRDAIIVHNVPLAIGANYGVLAMMFMSATLMLFLFLFVKFALLSIKTNEKIYVTAATCAFMLLLRPLISGAGVSMFSIGEWFAFGLLLATDLKVRGGQQPPKESRNFPVAVIT